MDAVADMIPWYMVSFTSTVQTVRGPDLMDKTLSPVTDVDKARSINQTLSAFPP